MMFALFLVGRGIVRVPDARRKVRDVPKYSPCVTLATGGRAQKSKRENERGEGIVAEKSHIGFVVA